MRLLSICSLSVASIFSQALLAAESNESITEIPYVADAATIDGKLTEASWASARQVELIYETSISENGAAPVKTTVYLYENGETLFIAFDARDPRPEEIRAYLRDRDAAYRDDFVGIVIDSFNDKRRAFEYFVNPLGVQMDLTNDDITREESDAWDAIWDSSGQINDNGYIVEMAIPLRTLRFKDTPDAKQWGVDLLRFYPRDKRYRLSNNKQDRNKSCYLCQLSTFSGMENVRPGNNMEIVPSVTVARADSRDVHQQQPWQNGDVETELSLDYRWGFTPNSSLNLTVNPDFSQVESDVLQLDVTTQFALFYPEKRPFFLEGAEYFSSPLNVVHTRNINNPDYGVKLTGREGNGTYGIFIADDTVTQLLIPGPYGSSLTSIDEPSENLAVRYRYDFNNFINVGVLATSRQADVYQNEVYGIDGKIRFSDSDAVDWQWLNSQTTNPDSIIADGYAESREQSDGAYYVNYDHQDRDWLWYVRTMDFGKEFRADLGFVPQADYHKDVVGLGHFWYASEGSAWHKWRLSGDWDRTVDDDGTELEDEIEAYLGVNGPYQTYIEVGAGGRDRRWENVVYRENYQSLFVSIDPLSGLHIEVFNRFGDQIDFANGGVGTLLSSSPEIRWNVSTNLSLNFAHTYSRLTVDGGELFTNNLTDGRATWQFNNRSFIRLTIQRGDVLRDSNLYSFEVNTRMRDLRTQLLYSYKINPQTVFFAGYSDGAIDDDNLSGLHMNERSVFSKLSYAFIP